VSWKKIKEEKDKTRGATGDMKGRQDKMV